MATLRSFSRLTMIWPLSPAAVAVSSTMLGDSSLSGSSCCACRVSAAARRPRRRSMSPSTAWRKADIIITIAIINTCRQILIIFETEIARGIVGAHSPFNTSPSLSAVRTPLTVDLASNSSLSSSFLQECSGEVCRGKTAETDLGEPFKRARPEFEWDERREGQSQSLTRTIDRANLWPVRGRGGGAD